MSSIANDYGLSIEDGQSKQNDCVNFMIDYKYRWLTNITTDNLQIDNFVERTENFAFFVILRSDFQFFPTIQHQLVYFIL